MLKLLKAHRSAYLREWYYSHSWTWRECYWESFIGTVHKWYALRFLSEMIDTPFLTFMREERHVWNQWFDAWTQGHEYHYFRWDSQPMWSECGCGCECRIRGCELCEEEYEDAFSDPYGGVEMDSETISMKEEFWIKD